MSQTPLITSADAFVKCLDLFFSPLDDLVPVVIGITVAQLLNSMSSTEYLCSKNPNELDRQLVGINDPTGKVIEWIEKAKTTLPKDYLTSLAHSVSFENLCAIYVAVAQKFNNRDWPEFVVIKADASDPPFAYFLKNALLNMIAMNVEFTVDRIISNVITAVNEWKSSTWPSPRIAHDIVPSTIVNENIDTLSESFYDVIHSYNTNLTSKEFKVFKTWDSGFASLLSSFKLYCVENGDIDAFWLKHVMEKEINRSHLRLASILNEYATDGDCKSIRYLFQHSF